MKGLERKTKAELIALAVEQEKLIAELRSQILWSQGQIDKWRGLHRAVNLKRRAAAKRAAQADAELGRRADDSPDMRAWLREVETAGQLDRARKHLASLEKAHADGIECAGTPDQWEPLRELIKRLENKVDEG